MITQAIKDFLKEGYDLSIPESLPEPVGYNILVLPLCARKKVGNIILPSDNEIKSRLASVVAVVLSVGKDAYPKERFPNGSWCQEGDFILLERDAGSKFTILQGDEDITNPHHFHTSFKTQDKMGLRLIADDQVRAKLNSFADIARVELNL